MTVIEKTLDALRTWDPSESTDAYKENLWKKLEKKMEENIQSAELDDEFLDYVAGGASLTFEEQKRKL